MRGMRTRLLVRCSLVLAGCVAAMAAAQAAHVCVGPDGKKTIQDKHCPDTAPRPPPPPPPTPLACALSPEQIRRANRLEDQFLSRYPDASAHVQAEERNVKPATHRIRDAEKRLKDLEDQRKPLDKEREFFPRGTQMPSGLKSKIDANDAQTAAMADILRGRKQELADIQARYQCERDTFGMMWKNAAPGSSACHPPACATP
jgi:hypothetical protein